MFRRKKQVVVKTYTGRDRRLTRKYRKELRKMVKKGYTVESQAIIAGRRGFFFRGTSDHMVVTYRLREAQD